MKNGGSFSKRVENIVEKGEITRDEQFLLSPRCFQKTSTTDTYKLGLVWERVKDLREMVLKTFWKQRKCWLPVFSPLPRMYFAVLETNPTNGISNLSSANALSFDECKILLCHKGFDRLLE